MSCLRCGCGDLEEASGHYLGEKDLDEHEELGVAAQISNGSLALSLPVVATASGWDVTFPACKVSQNDWPQLNQAAAHAASMVTACELD